MRECIGRAEWRTDCQTEGLSDGPIGRLTSCLHETANEVDHGVEDVQHDFPKGLTTGA